jgi:hypothetical protein
MRPTRSLGHGKVESVDAERRLGLDIVYGKMNVDGRRWT